MDQNIFVGDIFDPLMVRRRVGHNFGNRFEPSNAKLFTQWANWEIVFADGDDDDDNVDINDVKDDIINALSNVSYIYKLQVTKENYINW